MGCPTRVFLKSEVQADPTSSLMFEDDVRVLGPMQAGPNQFAIQGVMLLKFADGFPKGNIGNGMTRVGPVR